MSTNSEPAFDPSGHVALKCHAVADQTFVPNSIRWTLHGKCKVHTLSFYEGFWEFTTYDVMVCQEKITYSDLLH